MAFSFQLFGKACEASATIRRLRGFSCALLCHRDYCHGALSEDSEGTKQVQIMYVYVCGAVCLLCCVLGMKNSSDAFFVCIRAVGFDQVYAQHGSPAASQNREKTKNPDSTL